MTITTDDLGFEPLPELFQENFPPEEFSARRGRVFDALGDAIALLQGAPAASTSEFFRQDNDFFYLCGVEVPHAYLLLDGRERTASLYLPHQDRGLEASEGPRLNADDPAEASALTGVELVQGLESIAIDLQRLVLKRGALRCYTPLAPSEQARAMRDQLLRAAGTAASDPWDTTTPRQGRLARLIGDRFPQVATADLSPVLDRLRLVKSPTELNLLRHAGRLSGLALTEAMRSTRPGVMEFELAAVASFCFTAGGARGEGYRAIIGGGGNAWFGHYGRLGSPLRDGDLVLMDYAPDVAYYTSDIGRMWPVNGRYGTLQRLLYGFMVEYHRELLSLVRPGALPRAILDEAAGTMRERIDRLEFPEPLYRQAALATLGFAGHLSHPVGMSVHDVGDYGHEPLVPGMVFSIDPQLWAPDGKCYVRCEDTVVVTESGVENLTADAPLDPDEIEQAMMEASDFLPIVQARRSWAGNS